MFADIQHPDIILLLAPAVMFVVVIELVRLRRLREDYSLLWLITFAVLLILVLTRDTLLNGIAWLLGIAYPPAALFVVSFGLTLLIMLQFSMVITRLTRENKQAAQHIALLSARVRELERKLDETEKEDA